MNADALILTIVHQANTIREQAEELARLRRVVADLVPTAPADAPSEPPTADAT
jgi:hypothetical protein